MDVPYPYLILETFRGPKCDYTNYAKNSLKYGFCNKSFRTVEEYNSNHAQKWGQICCKSVQLVRGSFFRNDLLQIPYFSCLLNYCKKKRKPLGLPRKLLIPAPLYINVLNASPFSIQLYPKFLNFVQKLRGLFSFFSE